MSIKHKKVCSTLNYIEEFPVLASATTGCISICASVSLLALPIGIASSAIRSKICAIVTGIQTYKSIIKKKKEKHNKILLVAKSRLNRIEILISLKSIQTLVMINFF